LRNFTARLSQGGVLIVSGIIAAVVTAPLFDRVFTKHLGLVAKLLVPVLAIAWLSLIWDGAYYHLI
jgi:hypothetical protein